MKTIFHAMEEKILQQFIETKKELLEIAATVSAKERADGRKEIMEAATLFEVPADLDNPRDLFTVDDKGTAFIPISGKLTSQVDICDGFFSDCTTYGFIETAAIAADNDPSVNKIQFNISSGGGHVTGVDACGQVIANLKKPTEGMIFGMAASAAYWLGSQMDSLTVSAPTDFVGSIGVAVEIVDRTKMEEARGINRVVLTSTDAPDKRLDLASEDGQSKVIAELDSIHKVFASRVSTGRGVSIEKINSDFGQGGVVIAADAKKAGMIDKIQNEITGNRTNKATNPPAAAGTQQEEATNMASLTEVLAANPEAKTEHDNIVAAQATKSFAEGNTAGTETGKAEGRAEMKAVNDLTMPIISSAHYPEAVKTRVIEKAQTGDVEAIKDYVSMYDMTSEGIATANAIKEQSEETPAGSESVKTDAEKSEIEYQERLKKAGRA